VEGLPIGKAPLGSLLQESPRLNLRRAHARYHHGQQACALADARGFACVVLNELDRNPLRESSRGEVAAVYGLSATSTERCAILRKPHAGDGRDEWKIMVLLPGRSVVGACVGSGWSAYAY